MVLDLMPNKKIFVQRDVRETTIEGKGLTSKTSYYSITGDKFKPINEDDNISYGAGSVTANADGITFYADVNLPHGAIITSVVIYASVSDETFNLRRRTFPNIVSDISGATNMNNAATISQAINNQARSYFIETSSIDTGDVIYGGTIVYTTDYD